MSEVRLETMVYNHTRLGLIGNPASSHPLIVCFHGSGDSCDSWASLTDLLNVRYRVLLWDRLDHGMKAELAVHDLLQKMDRLHLQPPYLLIAHSYGGTFARLLLQERPDIVAGMVLAETGQETAIDSEVEKQQYEKQLLGNKPLVVIRGNTLIRKWEEFDEAVAAMGGSLNPNLSAQKQLLDATDKEDERLKKAQLALSRNHRYIHVPDCGHGIVRDRPEVVAEAVNWAMDNLHGSNMSQLTGSHQDESQRIRRNGLVPFVKRVARFLHRR